VHPAVIDDAGAGLAPQLDGRVIAADLVADFLEQLVCVALDGLRPSADSSSYSGIARVM